MNKISKEKKLVGNENYFIPRTKKRKMKNDITWLPKNTTRGDSIQSPSPIGPARTRGGLVGLYCQQKEETIENTHVLWSLTCFEIRAPEKS